MKIACCQFDVVWENKDSNHARVEALVQAARLPPQTLLLLPEMFDTGFSMNVAALGDGAAPSPVLPVSPSPGLPLSPPSARFLSHLARTHRLFVLGGLITTGPDGRGRNQAVAFGPDGAEIVRFTKLHSFTMAGENAHFTPGTAALVASLGGWRVAPLVCYDLRFPEAFRAGVRQGAQLFAVIANWPASRELHWVTLLRARAIENQAYVAGVNRIGTDPHASYCGRSLIIDPRGNILADGAAAEGIISADIDLASLEEYRRQFTALKDMRGDLR